MKAFTIIALLILAGCATPTTKQEPKVTVEPILLGVKVNF